MSHPSDTLKSVSGPDGLSCWETPAEWHPAELPVITASEAVPIASSLDLWDCWPLQREDGSTVHAHGGQYWFFLASERFDDPGKRHFHARIRMMHLSEGAWTDLGPVLDAKASPGRAEWAGSCVLHDDRRTVSLFFTASGRNGHGPSFEQRIFGVDGELRDDGGPGNWGTPRELFSADGRIFMPADKPDGAPGMIKAFRDPAWFRDPSDGQAYLLFTGSAGWSEDRYNGLVGYARRKGKSWILGEPLIHAVGVNNEMERPHIVVRDGLYYLFWSTQRHTFSPSVTPGPNGLYCAVAERFTGPWTPVNHGGLVATNPLGEPTQAYSWWVTGEGIVWSFIDHWGMKGRKLDEAPELLRSQFGGTPAPRFRLAFDGLSVTVVP